MAIDFLNMGLIFRARFKISERMRQDRFFGNGSPKSELGSDVSRHEELDFERLYIFGGIAGLYRGYKANVRRAD